MDNPQLCANSVSRQKHLVIILVSEFRPTKWKRTAIARLRLRLISLCELRVRAVAFLDFAGVGRGLSAICDMLSKDIYSSMLRRRLGPPLLPVVPSRPADFPASLERREHRQSPADCALARSRTSQLLCAFDAASGAASFPVIFAFHGRFAPNVVMLPAFRANLSAVSCSPRRQACPL
ncbi:hypothetical protein AK812_SmicGene26124 [Symbiodinium microadriaticum]|uniref:Uncharacterized protein n=1 Tax=Symbiodinium microadriaticum TaxID=2951 RepID=A0A1Q9DAF1_SYMMI|nr:hypothetical protein AK812_SmicGene26124 [Symbiodinium microadriaticum]